ncbi:MAG: NIPSNAP family protein, partial [Solirubrobacteraceae bacterium]
MELRQYTCRTGRRDALIDLFDREFVDALEAVGIRQIGQFRDLDDPDNFVWIRGFPEPEARRRTLPAFYESAAWETHKEEALATLKAWDNARQLRRTDAYAGFDLPAAPLSADVDPPPAALVVATLYSLTHPVDDHFVRFFEDRVRPAMIETGAPPIASFQTDRSENPYPRLPLRTGENMFVWFTTFATPEEHREHVARLGESRHWNDGVAPELARR